MLKIKKDYYAGGLMILLGLIAAIEGQNYNIGTLRQMGPGFFPVALGILLIFLGLLIAGTSLGVNVDGDDTVLPEKLEWRGWFCILAGPALFIIFGKIGGLVPATFACVFVSALGDRSTTVKGAAVLAAGVTVFGVVLFSYLLKMPMPVLKWGLS
ncbi:MAG: tripartite tricarboxylate transporter TctB family protein [Pseudolabrys sp.]|jgi:hypothetical protein